MRKILSSVLLISFFTSTTFAQENLFSNLDYPELQVSPRATERLAQLAEMEEKNTLLLEWTMITSGAMTLFAGAKQKGNYRDANPTDKEKEESDMAANAGMIVGAGWVTLGTVMGFKKWSGARLAEVKRIPGKDKRAELARERLAEEALEFASNTTSTLETLSVITNFATSIYLTSYSTDENRVYGLLAATTSFLPWLFPNVYHTTYEKHLEYKKKIYAPLVSMGLGNKLEPTMNWTWNF